MPIGSVVPSEGFRLFDGQDKTKKAKFILSGITPGNVRALTIPDQSGVISLEGHSHISTFLDLIDTPDGYDDVDIGKILQVRADLAGLEFTDCPTFTGLTLSNIAAESSDVDKFLVASSGVIKYRTGSQILSDIGGAAFAHSHAGNGSSGDPEGDVPVSVDSESNTLEKSHAYKAQTAGFVDVKGTFFGVKVILAYVGTTDDPQGAGTMLQYVISDSTQDGVHFFVAKDKYFEIISDMTVVIYWTPLIAGGAAPIDQD